MRGDEWQVGEVFVGQVGEFQVAVGEVDSLVGPELRAAGPGPGDLDVDLIGGHQRDHTADLAVVEPDPLVRAGTLEDRGEGTADGRGCQQPTPPIRGGRPAGRHLSGQG